MINEEEEQLKLTVSEITDTRFCAIKQVIAHVVYHDIGREDYLKVYYRFKHSKETLTQKFERKHFIDEYKRIHDGNCITELDKIFFENTDENCHVFSLSTPCPVEARQAV